MNLGGSDPWSRHKTLINYGSEVRSWTIRASFSSSYIDHSNNGDLQLVLLRLEGDYAIGAGFMLRGDLYKHQGNRNHS